MKCLFALIVALPALWWTLTNAAPERVTAESSSSPNVVQLGTNSEQVSTEKRMQNCKIDNAPPAVFQNLHARKSPSDCGTADPCRTDTNTKSTATPQTCRRPPTTSDDALTSARWPGGMARLRVRGGTEGTIDYGSAVCVGFGRKPGEWTFLSCSHNFESGGDPELQLAGAWVPATLLYRDKLAEAVETAPGQYTRVAAGPDRSVLVVNWSGRLRFRPVSLERYLGDVVLSGYPSCPRPVTIPGQTESHPSILRAALQRPSQGGFSGGGVFSAEQQLVGIWTSGAKGAGYGHYIFEFLPIFRELGWAPGNWRLTATDLAHSN